MAAEAEAAREARAKAIQVGVFVFAQNKHPMKKNNINIGFLSEN